MHFAARNVELDFCERAPWHFANEVELKATPEEVFDLFADGDSWPRWFPGIRKVVWTTPDPKGVGTTRSVTLDTATVHEYFMIWDRGRRFTFRFTGATMPLFRAGIEDYRLEALPDGRTRFRYDVYLEPSRLVGALAPVTRGVFARLFRAGTVGLKAYYDRRR